MHYESAAKLAEAKQIGGKVLASMTRESLAAALKLGPLQARKVFAELRDRAKGSAAKFFGKIGSESVAVPGFKAYRSSMVEEKFSLGQAPFIRSVQQTLSLQQCASLCAQATQCLAFTWSSTTATPCGLRSSASLVRASGTTSYVKTDGDGRELGAIPAPVVVSERRAAADRPIPSVLSDGNADNWPTPITSSPFVLNAAPATRWIEMVGDTTGTHGRVYVIHNFMTPEEAQHLMDLAKPKLARATVVGYGEGNPDTVSDSRTNTQCFLKKAQTPKVHEIEQRLGEVTKTRLDQGEDIQVLRYQNGQQFTQHQDFFSRDVKVHLARGGQRIATVLMYLHRAEIGGATYFPIQKLRLNPTEGDAILFWNVKPGGELASHTLGDYENDDYATHAGEPVLKGEKWVATRWIREDTFV